MSLWGVYSLFQVNPMFEKKVITKWKIFNGALKNNLEQHAVWGIFDIGHMKKTNFWSNIRIDLQFIWQIDIVSTMHIKFI